MAAQWALIGDLLVVVEEDPTSTFIDFDKAHIPPGSVEEGAIYGAWIIRHQPFAGDNREIGYEVMRQVLEEGGHPWPRPHEDSVAIEKMLIALEVGAITEAEFVDWVRLRVATA